MPISWGCRESLNTTFIIINVIICIYTYYILLNYIIIKGSTQSLTYGMGSNPWLLFMGLFSLGDSLLAQLVKSLPAMWDTLVRSLGQEHPLEKEMAAHSSILALKIPWMGEPGGLLFMGSQRAGHDWATSPLVFGVIAAHVDNQSPPLEDIYWTKFTFNASSLLVISIHMFIIIQRRNQIIW